LLQNTTAWVMVSQNGERGDWRQISTTERINPIAHAITDLSYSGDQTSITISNNDSPIEVGDVLSLTNFHIGYNRSPSIAPLWEAGQDWGSSYSEDLSTPIHLSSAQGITVAMEVRNINHGDTVLRLSSDDAGGNAANNAGGNAANNTIIEVVCGDVTATTYTHTNTHTFTCNLAGTPSKHVALSIHVSGCHIYVDGDVVANQSNVLANFSLDIARVSILPAASSAEWRSFSLHGVALGDGTELPLTTWNLLGQPFKAPMRFRCLSGFDDSFSQRSVESQRSKGFTLSGLVSISDMRRDLSVQPIIVKRPDIFSRYHTPAITRHDFDLDPSGSDLPDFTYSQLLHTDDDQTYIVGVDASGVHIYRVMLNHSSNEYDVVRIKTQSIDNIMPISACTYSSSGEHYIAWKYVERDTLFTIRTSDGHTTKLQTVYYGKVIKNNTYLHI